jgi:hypothetical protein
MKKKLTIFCIGLISFFSLSAFIKTDDPFLELLKKLDELTKKYPTESVYLHLDKPYYAVGDDIWFKAYVTEGRTAAPTTISNIIYVELINEKGVVVKLLKLPLQGGLSNGDFRLDDGLDEGNYRIRAYTQWMRNAGPAFFFDKTIKIGNSWANKVFTKIDYQYAGTGNLKSVLKFSNKEGQPYAKTVVNYDVQLDDKSILRGKGTTNENGVLTINLTEAQLEQKHGKIITTITMPKGEIITKTIPIKLPISQVDVQFFAEGGNLIENLPCKIAVKSININGLGENVNGVVIDNEGSEVLSFETTYLGMGNFTLTPGEGKTYRAKIKLSNGSEKIIELPKSQKSGYALAVNNTDTAKISIKVMLSPDLLNKGDLNLLAQHNGNVFFTTKVATTKQISTVTVPKKEIPSGIVQLTLFGTNNLPVSERIIFINNMNDKIELSAEGLKPSYGKKGNVTFDISALNNGSPVQGSYSIAVSNADIVAPDLDNESNILTGLLLNADLKGYIEKPNHYFLDNKPKTISELDNLLLTQGWRKIDWTAVARTDQTAPTFQAEKGMNISGSVTGKGKKPIANGKITLLSASKVRLVATTETDENGHFSFDDSIFGDSIRFALQASTKEDKKSVTVKLDKVPDQEVTVNKNTGDIEVNVNTSMSKYLKESNDYFDDQYRKGFLSRTNQLKTVNIVGKARRSDSASVNSSNLNGRGRANQIITAYDLLHTYDLIQYFKNGNVLGVTVDEDGNLINTRVEGMSNSGAAMAISIDGIVSPYLSLGNIDVESVESIEVLRGVPYIAMYGSDGANGLIVITMKRGSGRKMSDIYAPGLVTFMPKGYDMPRKFYSPKYNANPDTTPDLRTTVFWEPHLVTDAKGKANINFYNTDKTGNYRIVIEGIDATGNLARKVLSYIIK